MKQPCEVLLCYRNVQMSLLLNDNNWLWKKKIEPDESICSTTVDLAAFPHQAPVPYMRQPLKTAANDKSEFMFLFSSNTGDVKLMQSQMRYSICFPITHRF